MEKTKKRKKLVLKRWLERTLFYTFMMMLFINAMMAICYAINGRLNAKLAIITIVIGTITSEILTKFSRPIELRKEIKEML